MKYRQRCLQLVDRTEHQPKAYWTMERRRAECSCGQLSALCSGEPARVSVCHCLACKRRTGSAFSVNARFSVACVSIEGRAEKFVRMGDSGTRSVYSFCPICGITVFYQSDAERDLIAIPAGTFADPAFTPPSTSYYDDTRRCPWLEVRLEKVPSEGLHQTEVGRDSALTSSTRTVMPSAVAPLQVTK
jgi:hypothetical protein